MNGPRARGTMATMKRSALPLHRRRGVAVDHAKRDLPARMTLGLVGFVCEDTPESFAAFTRALGRSACLYGGQDDEPCPRPPRFLTVQHHHGCDYGGEAHGPPCMRGTPFICDEHFHGDPSGFVCVSVLLCGAHFGLVSNAWRRPDGVHQLQAIAWSDEAALVMRERSRRPLDA